MKNDKFFPFKLNTQQSKIFEELKSFIQTEEDKIFILKGYAGTGKTTLMSGLIKYLKDKKKDFQLLASTGRAAKILSDKSHVNARTIHSLIYTFNGLSEDLEKMHEDQKNNIDDKGQISLMFELNEIDSEDTIIYIVDEASMIADTKNPGTSFARFGEGELLTDLLKFNKTGKFIFLGDSCQLPPINQTDSPALSKNYISKSHTKNVKEFQLTQIMRQAEDNDIINASFLIRRYYEKNPSIDMLKFPKLPFRGKQNIELVSTHANFITKYVDSIKRKGKEHATLICRSNQQCRDMNKIIRSILFETSQAIQIGDLLLVTQNNQLVNLVNGDLIEILAIGKSEYRCGLNFINVKVQELASKSKFNLLLIEDILNSSSTNITEKQHKDLMIDYYLRMKRKGVDQNSQTFKDSMRSDPYLNAIKSVYGYALTCHKSQGGEWEEVFLFLENKMYGMPRPGLFQWWYTAITRAKSKLSVVDEWFIN